MPGNSGGGVFALAMAASERMFIISFPFKKQKNIVMWLLTSTSQIDRTES
jgi:hypothetical protein